MSSRSRRLRTKQHSQGRRAAPVAAALCALLLDGCSDSPWAGVLELVARPLPPIETRVPSGPGLQLTLDGRNRGVAELLQEVGERRMWRTANGLVVATDGARVVATAGLPQVLAGTRMDGPDPLADPAALLERPASTRRLVDLMAASRDPASMRFGVPVECRISARAVPEQQALLVEERCRAPGTLGFTNRFWVDAGSNAVYRSEQWVGPGLLLGVAPIGPDAVADPGEPSQAPNSAPTGLLTPPN